MSLSLKAKTLTAVVLVIAVVGLIGLAVGVETVDEGETKVVKDKGAVTGEMYEPGWHVHNPATKSTVTIPTRPQTYTMSGNPWEGETDNVDSIQLYTNDEQQANVDVTVRYRVQPEKAPEFHSEWNNIGQAETRAVRPVVQSVVQAEGSSLNARELISKDGRQLLAEQTQTALEEENIAGVTIESVEVRDIHLQPEFAAQMEQVEVENERARQKVIAAEADAEAYAIRGEAIRENPEVLTEQYIEQLDRTDTIYIPTGQEDGMPMFLEVSKKSESEVAANATVVENPEG